jgi:hypothetical protein
VLRKIFGSKWDKVPGELGRVHNERLYNLFCSQNIIMVIKSTIMRRTGHVARMGEEKIYIWQADIKRDVQMVGWDLDWIDLA